MTQSEIYAQAYASSIASTPVKAVLAVAFVLVGAILVVAGIVANGAGIVVAGGLLAFGGALFVAQAAIAHALDADQ
ncbi:MAG: hypothetical protein E7A62_09115 [Actinomycetaceae bacterium]|nr:hypothetical protein [Actinomycetaceae bacterium]MDU0971130.1 hypothetical protein [Actinomycetaceae bacterium]